MPYSASPPGLRSRLKMTVWCPAWAIFCAAKRPAGPAPTTNTVFTLVSSGSVSRYDAEKGRRTHVYLAPRACADLAFTACGYYLPAIARHPARYWRRIIAHPQRGLVEFF